MSKEPKYVKIIPPKEIYSPINIPPEILIILWGRADLMGLFLSLMLLSKTESKYLPQPKLAKLLGLSYLSFLNKRKELEKLGLLETEISNNNMTRISLCYEGLWGLIKIIRGSYKNYKTPFENNNSEEVADYLVRTGKSLVETLKKQSSETDKPLLLDNIYIYNTNNLNNNNTINNNTIDNNKDNEKVTAKTYPREDYTLILDAFKKYKGVNLMGPEISYHMRAIKLMFQAERKPEQIISFMKWLYDNQRNEETPWVKTWTIWTVQKKISEFVAGKLDISTGKEDLERI